MELTIEQALKKGIALHQAGKLQEAERFYRSILNSQPLHPDANHNLGVIAVSVNKPETALEFFKTALETNPRIEQFWLSYIEALIKVEQFETAGQMIKKAEEKNLASDKLNLLKERLISSDSKENENSTTPSKQQLSELLKEYQNGNYSYAERLASSLSNHFPNDNFSWKILAAIFKATRRFPEAVSAGQKAVELNISDAEAHFNLGNTLQELERLEEAEKSYLQATILRPDYADAHYNHGITLKKLGNLEKAEQSYLKAIAINPDYAEAHFNLGNTLQELERLEEAEKSYLQATVLKPDYSLAYNNLGNVQMALGNLEQAVLSYNKALESDPGLIEANRNIAILLKDLARFDEAEKSFKKVIALKPDHSEAYNWLGIVQYSNDNINSAIESLEVAKTIDPNSEITNLLLPILHARKARKTGVNRSPSKKISIDNIGLSNNPTYLTRAVEPELINCLYDMQSREMDKAKNSPVFGNGRCSIDYNVFKEDRAIIRRLENDLTRLMKEAVNSDIYLQDSFFNIYGAGAGIPPHNHLNELDKNTYLNLAKQKFSLVYYLSVGDQNCDEPGILKLYEPDEEILPTEGMIIIFPADRLHSAVYSGKIDRVIIGLNFYSI